jgi:hypothetical protein
MFIAIRYCGESGRFDTEWQTKAASRLAFRLLILQI